MKWRGEDPVPVAEQAECLWAATGGVHVLLTHLIHTYTYNMNTTCIFINF